MEGTVQKLSAHEARCGRRQRQHHTSCQQACAPGHRLLTALQAGGRGEVRVSLCDGHFFPLPAAAGIGPLPAPLVLLGDFQVRQRQDHQAQVTAGRNLSAGKQSDGPLHRRPALGLLLRGEDFPAHPPQRHRLFAETVGVHPVQAHQIHAPEGVGGFDKNKGGGRAQVDQRGGGAHHHEGTQNAGQRGHGQRDGAVQRDGDEQQGDTQQQSGHHGQRRAEPGAPRPLHHAGVEYSGFFRCAGGICRGPDQGQVRHFGAFQAVPDGGHRTQQGE